MITGIKGSLKESQAYPDAFGEEVARLFLSWHREQYPTGLTHEIKNQILENCRFKPEWDQPEIQHDDLWDDAEMINVATVLSFSANPKYYPWENPTT